MSKARTTVILRAFLFNSAAILLAACGGEAQVGNGWGATLQITTQTLPYGQIGNTYVAQLAAIGSAPNHSWSIASGTLPAGLVLNEATGTISGTPTDIANGVVVGFTVTENTRPPRKTATSSFVLYISPNSIEISNSAAPPLVTVAQTSSLVSVTNDLAGFQWSITPGSGTSVTSDRSLSGSSITFTPTKQTGAYAVTATSLTDPTKSATARIGVTNPNLCIAPEKPAPASGVTVTPAYANLSFYGAVAMTKAPGDPSTWYVLGRLGQIWSFPDDQTATQSAVNTFADITATMPDISILNDWEAGALGLAFHPDYAKNGRLFIAYTAASSDPRYVVEWRLSEFTSTDRAHIDAGSERVLISGYKSYSFHNGGQLLFGKDGYLYVTIGDAVIGTNAQDKTNLFGKILRLDVNTPGTYSIPPGNPFAGTALCRVNYSPFVDNDARVASCPEIYAYGFRNPWRASFDRAGESSALWVGDVGDAAFEEIDQVTAPGGNYGWSWMEGRGCRFNYNCLTVSSDGQAYVPPIEEIPHPEMNAVIGGYIYRGQKLSGLQGTYIFSNFSPGIIHSLVQAQDGTLQRQTLAETTLSIASFAEDTDGELFIVDLSGKIYQFASSTGGTNTIPEKLTETGCVDPGNPAAGGLAYQVNAPFWSNGATKTRFISLPAGTHGAIQEDGHVELPPGTVLRKDFRVGSQLVETRLMMRHTGGEWRGYTYKWNADQTDATRVHGGQTDLIDGQPYHYPSEAECMRWHTAAAGSSLGFELKQLSRTGWDLAEGAHFDKSQIEVMQLFGILGLDASEHLTTPLVDPRESTTASVESRARSYLHTNCSFCHRPGGGTAVNMDLRITATTAEMGVCNVDPIRGNLGVSGAKRIAPGDPSHSLIIMRMNATDGNRMPPIGITKNDEAGANLLISWIAQMGSECQAE